MANSQMLPLVTPRASIRGARPDYDPSALPATLLSEAVNLRPSGGVLRVRQGTRERLMTVPVAGASFRGAWSGIFRGGPSAFVAFRVGTATRVFRLTLSPTLAWHSEITATNRFSADGPIAFSAFQDRRGTTPGITNGNVLVMSNGVEAKVFDPEDSRFPFGPTVQNAVTPPRPDPARVTSSARPVTWVTVAWPGTSWNIHVISMPPHYTSGHTYNSSRLQHGVISTPGQAIEIRTRPTPAVNGDAVAFGWAGTSACTFEGVDPPVSTATAFNLTESRTFMLLCDRDYLENFQIQIFNAVDMVYVSVWDPTSPSFSPPLRIPLSGIAPGGLSAEGWFLYVFSLGGLPAFPTQTSGIRFTVRGPVPTSDTMRIAAIMGGGRLPGGALYEMSHIVGAARCESAATVAVPRPQAFVNFGAATAYSFDMPDDPGAYYQYHIVFPDMLNTIADHAMFYRMDAGETRAYHLGLNGYFEFDSTLSTFLERKRDNQDTERDLSLPSPGDIATGLPAHRASAPSANRMVLAGVLQNEVWISDQRFLRFRPIVETDKDGNIYPESGTFFRVSGETVQALHALPTAFGTSPLALFTDQNVWRIEGLTAVQLSSASLISPHGTLHPRSIASHEGHTYYIDSDLTARMITWGTGAQNISVDRIQRLLQSLDLSACQGVAYNDQYTLAYRVDADGTGNRRTQNFLLTEREWWEDRYSVPNMDIAAFLPFVPVSGRRQVLAITNEGRIYETEHITTDRDAGQFIPWRFTTRDVSLDGWANMECQGVGVMCDAQANTTLDITLFTRWNNVTRVGAVDAGVTTPNAYRWARETGLNTMGGEGPEMRVTVSSNQGVSRWALRSLMIQLKATRDARAD